MPRHDFPKRDDGDDEHGGAAPGREAYRWPGAPEPVYDENGNVTNARADCKACGEPSTIGYRCSECGADLTGGGSS